MEFNVVYEDLESFFPSQNMLIEDVHTEKFSKICQSRLLRTSSLIWPASLLSEHKVVLLMCRFNYRCTFFSDISLISDAMSGSCF
jgi:hypothetical protein